MPFHSHGGGLGMALHQRKFDEAIPVNSTLVDKSARCRSPHAWLETDDHGSRQITFFIICELSSFWSLYRPAADCSLTFPATTDDCWWLFSLTIRAYCNGNVLHHLPFNKPSIANFDSAIFCSFDVSATFHKFAFADVMRSCEIQFNVFTFSSHKFLIYICSSSRSPVDVTI